MAKRGRKPTGGAPKVRLNTYIRPDVGEKLRTLAGETGRTQAQIVDALIHTATSVSVESAVRACLDAGRRL